MREALAAVEKVLRCAMRRRFKRLSRRKRSCSAVHPRCRCTFQAVVSIWGTERLSKANQLL